jgi:Zn-dependent peptidase ImmA (M78 family)/DNA-binding XRE family transcriptional regulator
VSTDTAIDVARAFDRGRLRVARQLAELRKSDVAARIDVSPTAVSAWEAGTKRPTAESIRRLAMALGVEIGFFVVRGDEQPIPVPHFRSLRSTTQVARDKAQAFGILATDIARSMERYVELPDVLLPHHEVALDDDPSTSGPEDAARELREAWQLGAGPIRHLLRIAENNGVLVVFSPASGSTVDAYSFTASRPLVVLDPSKGNYYRQRFDIAHELGHLVMHTDAEPGSKIIESQAHRFAAELLMPADALGPQLPTSISRGAWERLARLKEEWGVSIQALLFRARALGVLSDNAYRNAMTTVTQRGWRRSEPGLISALEQPSLLPQAVQLLSSEGYDEVVLARQAGAPLEVYRTATSRTPQTIAS